LATVPICAPCPSASAGGACRDYCTSEEFDELVNREAGLLDDGAESAPR
jgi:hypothetical protein